MGSKLSGDGSGDGNDGGIGPGLTALGKNLGPAVAALQTQPGRQLAPFAPPDASFIAPPPDQLQALLAQQDPNKPQQRSAFYGG